MLVMLQYINRSKNIVKVIWIMHVVISVFKTEILWQWKLLFMPVLKCLRRTTEATF